MKYNEITLLQNTKSNNKAIYDFVRELERLGYTLLEFTFDGKKKLAYKIAEQEFARFYTFTVRNESDKAEQLHDYIKNEKENNGEILRWLIITIDGESVKKYENIKE